MVDPHADFERENPVVISNFDCRDRKRIIWNRRKWRTRTKVLQRRWDYICRRNCGDACRNGIWTRIAHTDEITARVKRRMAGSIDNDHAISTLDGQRHFETGIYRVITTANLHRQRSGAGDKSDDRRQVSRRDGQNDIILPARTRQNGSGYGSVQVLLTLQQN